MTKCSSLEQVATNTRLPLVPPGQSAASHEPSQDTHREEGGRSGIVDVRALAWIPYRVASHAGVIVNPGERIQVPQDVAIGWIKMGSAELVISAETAADEDDARQVERCAIAGAAA